MCHGVCTPAPPPHATHSHATPLPPPLASHLSPPLPPGAVYTPPPPPSTHRHHRCLHANVMNADAELFAKFLSFAAARVAVEDASPNLSVLLSALHHFTLTYLKTKDVHLLSASYDTSIRKDILRLGTRRHRPTCPTIAPRLSRPTGPACHVPRTLPVASHMPCPSCPTGPARRVPRVPPVTSHVSRPLCPARPAVASHAPRRHASPITSHTFCPHSPCCHMSGVAPGLRSRSRDTMTPPISKVCTLSCM